MPIPDRTPSTWHLSPEQRRALLHRRLAELRGWRDRRTLNLDDWFFTAPGTYPVPVRLGQAWPQVDIAVAGGPVLFEMTFAVPEGFVDAELELDVGGEALVTVSGGVSGGLNPYHRRFRIGGEVGAPVVVRVEAVPKGLFGTPSTDARLLVARLVVPEPSVEDLALDLEVLLGAVAVLGSHPAVPHLLTAAEDALAPLPWTSDLQAYLGRLDTGVGVDLGGIWNPPPQPSPQPLADSEVAAVAAARAALQSSLQAVRARFPAVGALALSGHAHLDLAWLWPMAETKRKAVRTFQTVLTLMDQFPDFTFNQSSAQLYAWIEAEMPELFARIRERVQEGRWETVGGMWVEPDGMMSGGESLARQLLYGQRYFESRFGRRSTVAWLPDTFGFSGALPQLLRQGGLNGFFTTKLTWNETTLFPHDLWWWEGQDGTRVLAHSFKNDSQGTSGLGSYNGDISAEHLMRVYANDRSAALPGWRGRTPESLFTYGYGDGAGGPSAEMLRRYERLRDFPGLPALRHRRVDEFFADLPQDGLPVWVGELYFELHRGTLSSQAAIKHLHRQAEARLIEADTALALAGWAGHPAGTTHAALEAHWKTLLLNEFHDILPGSSIREVYADAVPQLQDVVSAAARLRDDALGGAGDGWTVWNPTLFPRPLRVLLPEGVQGVTLDGTALPVQAVPGGTLVVGDDVTVPPLGSVTLQASTAAASRAVPATVTEDLDGIWLNSGAVRVLVTPDGQLARLVTPEGREGLGAGGHRLVAFRDLPRAWEAWDINPDTQDAALGEELPAGTVTVLERGPLRVSVQVEREWRGSRITQTVLLTAGSRRVDLRTRAQWEERRTLLKAFVDVNARSDHATFETAFGVTRRPTHRNHLSDAARFEGSAHRFADLSEPGFGLALLNDGKYGHSAYGSSLSLTLLRGPMYPDPLADVGEHEFTYSLLPHGGDWTRGAVLEEALDLNGPLVARPGTGGLPAGPFRLEGLPVSLGTLKVAEASEAAGDAGGLILRVYEPYGARGELHIVTPGTTRMSRTNLIEDDLPDDLASAPDGDHTRWTVPVRPFEVLSFRLRPGGPAD